MLTSSYASFDLDMLVECDEEYWEHPDPEQAFKQPPGIPSRAAYWIATMKLTDILGFAHRTIVSFARIHLDLSQN